MFLPVMLANQTLVLEWKSKYTVAFFWWVSVSPAYFFVNVSMLACLFIRFFPVFIFHVSAVNLKLNPDSEQVSERHF